jgi:hypothetical protein
MCACCERYDSGTDFHVQLAGAFGVRVVYLAPGLSAFSWNNPILWLGEHLFDLGGAT